MTNFVKMSEEKKENPDWLSDLQNNQATSDKQTGSEKQDDQIILDIYGPTNAYNSPRYGRRSNTGVKSVENSPKKSPFLESKSYVVRSSSARPALLNNSISSKDLRYEILKDQNVESFTSSLQFLQNDLENFSFYDLSESLDELGDSSTENVLKSKKIYGNLEDSWNSLNVFNIKQKGRLGSITQGVFTNGRREDKDTKNTQKLQVLDKNIFRDDKFKSKSKSKKSLEDLKWKNKTGNWRKSKNLHENGSISKNNVSEVDTKDFIIPELPQGKTLIFNIKTTWGDKHYLGLNGIEIFNSKGKKVQVKSIMADPPNINILSEYSKDPRVVENLIDNVYLTQDDVHMWLAPFTPNSSHLIIIQFYKLEELAMLRIWNYNKSRIHCFRGVKDVEIKLDNRFIFIGEIARASGEIISTLNCLGDTILFTTDNDILELVSENDEYFIYSSLNHEEVDQTTQEEFRPLTGGNKGKQVRPFTCPKKSNVSSTMFTYLTQNETQHRKQFAEGDYLETLETVSFESKKQLHFSREETDSNCIKEIDCDVSEVKNKVSSDKMRVEKMENNLNWENDLPGEESDFPDQNFTLYIPSASFLTSDSAYETLSMPTGYNFTIQIHSTWGDLYYVGLNGLQIFDENNTKIQIHPNNITADPESINVLEGIDNDARTPDKLIDGINDSMDGCHMWLAPVLPLTINQIDLTFQDPVTLSAVKLWNYAKTPSRGVREFGILVDGLLIYNGELDQTVIPIDGGLPKVPCKTVVFSDPERFQNNKNITMESGILRLADQSQRPLTTMTSHS